MRATVLAVPLLVLACDPAAPAPKVAPPAAAPTPPKVDTRAAGSTVPHGKPDPSLLPRKVLFGAPDKTSVKLSPDGKRISYLAVDNGVTNVFVAPTDAPEKAEAVTHDTKRGIRSYTWAFSSSHVLYRQDEGGDSNFHVHVVDLGTKVDKDLTPAPRVQARIEARSRKQPTKVIVASNERDPRAYDAFLVDIVTGKRELVLANDQDLAAVVYDDDLAPRVGLKIRPDGGTGYFELTKKKKGFFSLTPMFDVPLEDTIATSPLAIDAAGKTLYLTDSRGRDTAALVAVDLKSKATKVLVDDGQADVEGATFDPRTLVPQGAQASYQKPRWHLADDTLAPDFEVLRELAKGDGFDVVSRSQDDTRWLVMVSASDGPNRYYLYERPKDKKAKREPRALFLSHAALGGKKLAPMHALTIRARDGLTLVSYLTLPVGADADGDGKPEAPLPMVLLVHGGPWSRDTYGLSPHAQWLASRGYAVLSVNFRGSTGFGKAFVRAGDREWGGKMQEDLLDAVAYAEAEKIAAKDRTAIMGGSYGGYAALVGLTSTPERFACGVDIAGPSSLVTFLGAAPPMLPGDEEQITRRIGEARTPEGKAFLASRSPLGLASQVRRPLLVGQGKHDPRATLEDTTKLVADIAAAKQPVTLVVYPDEGHGFVRLENRLSFHALAESFLAGCLGGPYEPVGDDLRGSSITIPHGKSEIEGLP